jgi:hypothetical protein
MNPATVRASRAWLVALLTLLLVAVLGANSATAATYVYDPAVVVSRSDVRLADAADPSSVPRSDASDRSVWPLAEAHRTATTPSARSVATEAAGTRIPWNSYADYPKVTINGREYANVGGRPYTQHAVDRLQPSGLGAPAGASGPGRSIAPGYVDDVLTGSQTVRKPVVGPNGEARVSHVSGSVEVITEGDTVITVITR